MDEIEVAVKSFGGDNQKSTLLDQFERLSVEIQLNQAMLRRSLSEPGSMLFPAPPPPVVRQAIEQGKRGSWTWPGLTFHRMVKKLLVRPRLRPMMFRRKKKGKKNDHDHDYHDHDDDQKEQREPSKDLKAWRRFSKSVRL